MNDISSPEYTSSDATFAISPDDPRATQNRGGLASDAGNEGHAGILPTDGGTVGLVTSDAEPGGDLPSPDSATGMTAPQVEMTDVGVADIAAMDMDATGDDENQ